MGSPVNPEEKSRLEASQEVDKPLLGGNHSRPPMCPSSLDGSSIGVAGSRASIKTSEVLDGWGRLLWVWNGDPC